MFESFKKPCLIAVFLFGFSCSKNIPSPPVAEKRPVETTLFGDTRTDPYSWMHNRNDTTVIAHLENENAYTDAILASLLELRDELCEEIKSKVPESEEFPPEPDGQYEYFDREKASLDYPVYLRKPIGGGQEEVVLDINELAKGHDYYKVTHHAVSPNGTMVAYLEDTNGDDVAALRIRSLDGSSDQLIHPEEVSAYALAWSKDGSALYYTKPDQTQRSSEVWRHLIGSDSKTDKKLFEENDGRFWVELITSRSDDWIFIHSVADDASRILVIDASNNEYNPVEIVGQKDEVRVTEIEHLKADEHSGWFLAVNDGNGALDGQLVRRKVLAGKDEPWEVLVPEQPGVQIRTFAVIREWLVFEERRDGQRVVRVSRHDGSDEHIVPTTLNPGLTIFYLGPEYDREDIGLITSGPLSAFAVHRYSPETRKLTTVFQRKPAFDVEQYETGVLFGIASDGTSIPVTYLRPKNVPKDGSCRTVLTGYGAIGVIMEPLHQVFREYASLLERGFTVAIAHPRGGGYYGKRWHNAGKLENSDITFSDFVAAVDGLFEAGFTSPEKLALVGGSAGGLLVAAAINLRPDLAKVVVAQVPFVDCLNSMLDPSLPATTLDYPEYGNPAEEERYYKSIKSFAPYENIGEFDYPDILAIQGINDARVAFWESVKWVARIREKRIDRDGLTLLRMNMGAGHSGSSGRRDVILEQAEWMAFILDRIK
jgi:oligopeptidase B